MVGKRHRDFDRLDICYRCQKRNIQQLSMSVDDMDPTALVYSAWCFTCNEHFAYRLRVETVWDREGRI